MEKIGLFIRMTREAHGITQMELAEKLGISQAAIAQFERLKATLSPETIINMAPLLNLNPDYVADGIGNPFKQRRSNEIIKMFFSEDPLGNIDFSLIDLIADKNEKAVFIFLKPAMHTGISSSLGFRQDKTLYRQILQQERQGNSIYALVIQDDDKNIFLFKRKNNNLFNENDLISLLHEKALSEKKYFDISISGIGYKPYKDIREGAEKLDWINDLIKHRSIEKKAFLVRLAKDIWSHSSMMGNKDEYAEIKREIEKIPPEKIDHLLSQLMIELSKILRFFLKPKH
jgi:transcriptional regulator with XRE-family HTH domain